ncbi:MAG: hypothetical protein ACJ04O_12950 [Cellvibrionales bacterium]
MVGWGIGNQHTTALERADLPLDVAYTGGFQILNEPPSNGQTATDNTGSTLRAVITTRLGIGVTHQVNPGESIQSAVRQAQSGDTIRVMPGTYSETVYIDKDDIHFLGVIIEGQRATLDGLGKLNDAILYSGNNIVIENFKIVRYKGNGIMSQAGNNF